MTEAERRRRAAAAAAAKAKSDADIARSNADAARAAADAVRAKAAADADIARIQVKAQADRIAADAEARRLADAAARRKAVEDKARAEAESRRLARERAWQLGINVTAPLAGMTAGYLLARGLQKKTTLAVKAQAPQLAALASEIRRTLPKRGNPSAVTRAKLAAAVTTSRRLHLVRPGPVGAVTAGLLLAEGAFSRFVLAPSVENPVGREALQVVGTASVFAATTLIGKRIEQNRIATAVRNSRDVLAVETARRMVTGGGTMLHRMAAGHSFRAAYAGTAGVPPTTPRPAAAPAAPRPSATVTPLRGIRGVVALGTAAAVAYTAARAPRRPRSCRPGPRVSSTSPRSRGCAAACSSGLRRTPGACRCCGAAPAGEPWTTARSPASRRVALLRTSRDGRSGLRCRRASRSRIGPTTTASSPREQGRRRAAGAPSGRPSSGSRWT